MSGTAPTIKQLMASGEQLEQKDNENQTALGYACRTATSAPPGACCRCMPGRTRLLIWKHGVALIPVMRATSKPFGCSASLVLTIPSCVTGA